MNKMIQRQDIVPPWIEKQQELIKAAHVFRARLRNDWKRQAARTIASRGGTLHEQMRRADLYALAEAKHNPRRTKVEQVAVPTNATDDPIMLSVMQEADSTSTAPVQVKVDTRTAEEILTEALAAETQDESTQPAQPVASDPATPKVALPAPFRIPEWEAAERSYHTLAISNLNTLTRTYNLMAPDLAKKPYYHLARELASCYSDVAPQIAEAIKERSLRPPQKINESAARAGNGGILDKFAGEKARIYDSKAPHYGLKEWWADIFGKNV
jgi:hypothetical protein